MIYEIRPDPGAMRRFQRAIFWSNVRNRLKFWRWGRRGKLGTNPYAGWQNDKLEPRA